MVQSSGRSVATAVGEYIVGKQIGSGSFSVVWHARHRAHGTEVAIKEIAMGRLNKKLQESLTSEISILKQITHPNIIRLHDIIEGHEKIHLVLEYCKGGDLSVHIQHRGRVSEAIATHWMQQLAAGLKILRDNNLIHRDLKPQNLLLSSTDENSVLKIADFGFARSLQPTGLAETLCGSPLYMAPEIMQLQKYDAKADLWSVGAILFQIVTGRPPFNGNNPFQLQENILKAAELHFPPDCRDLSYQCKDLCQKLLRCNPVERLTFEEFFDHPFLSHGQAQMSETLSNRRSTMILDTIPSSERDPGRKTEECSQEECLPFFLDDDRSGPDRGQRRRPTMKTSYGFTLDSKVDRREEESRSISKKDLASRYGTDLENSGFRHDSCGPLQGIDECQKGLNQRSTNAQSGVLDSMESIDQDYVFVSGPPIDMSSSSVYTSKPSHLPYKPESPQASQKINTLSVSPVLTASAAVTRTLCIGDSAMQSYALVTSQGSMDVKDALAPRSNHCMTRIRSLQQCVNVITELVCEKIKAGKQLEAFAIQLVILAIWKQALHIFRTQAASAVEGSPSQDGSRLRRSSSNRNDSSVAGECDAFSIKGLENVSSQIEREFIREVEHAEELAKAIEAGNTEVPDAMETIFQSALALGRRGGVKELVGNMETAAILYSKAVHLLYFLLVEASCLMLNPPFSLTNSGRYRLRAYIDILSKRQDHSRSQRMAVLDCEHQESTSWTSIGTIMNPDE